MTSNDRLGLPSDSPRAGTDLLEHIQGEASYYKERFYALRDKFEHATAIHSDHETALETAQAKLKDLQAECDMLLDTIAMQVSSQPTLMHYLDNMPPAGRVSAAVIPHATPALGRGTAGTSTTTTSAHAHPHAHPHRVLDRDRDRTRHPIPTITTTTTTPTTTTSPNLYRPTHPANGTSPALIPQHTRRHIHAYQGLGHLPLPNGRAHEPQHMQRNDAR